MNHLITYKAITSLYSSFKPQSFTYIDTSFSKLNIFFPQTFLCVLCIDLNQLWVQALAMILWVSLNLWEVCFGLGWTIVEGVNGVATLFRSTNHKYNALRGRIDLYQSTCLEFMYEDEKVLGT